MAKKILMRPKRRPQSDTDLSFFTLSSLNTPEIPFLMLDGCNDFKNHTIQFLKREQYLNFIFRFSYIFYDTQANNNYNFSSDLGWGKSELYTPFLSFFKEITTIITQ